MEIPQLALANGTQCTVAGLDKINVLVGKNGCGKSSILKAIENLPTADHWGVRRYISPERGGALVYDSGVEQQATNNPTYLADNRRNNQAAQFRQQSIVQYRRLLFSVLEEIETDEQMRSDHTYTFKTYIERINKLLDNIEIQREGQNFRIHRKGTNDLLQPINISSGESELISLAIECLNYSREVVPGKDNLLLLDEPDVHLHPDLQSRLAVVCCQWA